MFLDRHAHGVVAAVHMNYFASDARGQVGQREQGGGTDVVDIRVAPQRSVRGRGPKNLAGRRRWRTPPKCALDRAKVRSPEYRADPGRSLGTGRSPQGPPSRRP